MAEIPNNPIALVTALLLTGCGGAPAPSGSAPTNGGDVASVAAGAAVAARAGVAAAPLPLPEGAMMLVRATIEDPGVIAAGPALTALVPAGWRTHGGVVAAKSLCAEPFAVDWQVESPDGASTIAIFPTEIWQWSTYAMQSECTHASMRSAQEYLQAKIAQMIPGARVLDYRERPDFAKSAAEYAARMSAMYAQSGLPLRAWAEGGETLFAFQREGAEMRGVMGVTAVFYGGRVDNPMGGFLEQLTGSTLGTFMATAPNGKLDFELVEASRRSVAPQPKWLAQLFAVKNAIGESNVKATQERAALIVAGGAEATRSNIAAFQQMAQASVANSNESIARQSEGTVRENFRGDAAGDRMQRENIEVIRGVETYRDPVAGTNVQLDANYEHAWRVNNQEAYILTRDPNFNPGAYNIEATKMGAVQ
ncbi:MAG: hypothetical protein ABI859_05825 [Pseudomonadota bacterium]